MAVPLQPALSLPPALLPIFDTAPSVSGGKFGPKLDLADSARHLCPPGLTPELCPTFKTPETSFQATCLEANVTDFDTAISVPPPPSFRLGLSPCPLTSELSLKLTAWRDLYWVIGSGGNSGSKVLWTLQLAVSDRIVYADSKALKVPQVKSLERTEFVGSSLTRGGGLWSSFCCQFKLRGNYGKKFLGLATAPSAGYSSSKCSGFNSLKCLGFNNYFNGFDLKWVRCALVFKTLAPSRCAAGLTRTQSGADKLSPMWGLEGETMVLWIWIGTESMPVRVYVPGLTAIRGIVRVERGIFNQAQLHAVFSVSKGHILSNSRRPSVETRSFHSRCILHLPWILANDWNPRCRGKGTNVSPEGTMAANSTNGGHALSRVNGKRLELGKREESGRGGNPSKDKGAGEQESQPSTRLGSREELWLGASPARKRGSQQNIAAENSTSSSLVEDNKIWLNSWLVQNRGAAELHCGVGNLSKGNRIYLQLLLQAVGIIKWGTGTKIRYNGDAHAYCATVELAQ
ncbi:hypothetical protein C8R46DRAFT_1038360 [Mycena filopes]|nr:hypothetical protein C8R46DRAFT_1038360 [Mycena filopes]